MTEDEAKTKACFRAATFGGSQQLADGPGPNCIGSACMAWRWGQKKNPNWKSSVPSWSSVPSHPEDGPAHYVTDTKNGFCGLAGKPND